MAKAWLAWRMKIANGVMAAKSGGGRDNKQ